MKLLENIGFNAKEIAEMEDSIPSLIMEELNKEERLVLNNRAKAFYSQLSANDSRLKNIVKQSVMTSRNCLIRNHCLCSKDGGKTSGYTLVIGKHRFKIVCDCVACKMHLIAL